MQFLFVSGTKVMPSVNKCLMRCAAVAAIAAAALFSWQLYCGGNRVLVSDVDLGKVASGETVTFHAPVKNKSGRDLSIPQALSCCGAVVTDYPPLLRPGEESEIVGTVRVPRGAGRFKKKVVVFCEQDGYSQHIVYIRGESIVAVKLFNEHE